ncbi:SDR family NAD(P)-dependent oxidoreductase [Brachybacterium sacelli]|uniref:NAD(P)-dependent dehydrogenase (Short-subunit alcohol dehydrogenase family) n=1 Tax=Brachybacterium sacelli TaxID=173364 RepID=A0ABS4WX37_9MICO|nr:SDR family oxidoreductase [Brachybacterium sacelli]MBP2380774.1 NAD(P)-dependent dehydrogenase (short-subunit alcohol dehydrogenase family) [Brachybacterium sacelli]
MPALTSASTLRQWLAHPEGRPLLEGLLDRAEVPADVRSQIASLPLQQLVDQSRGKLPQSVVDDLVRQVNGGELPAEEPPAAGAARFTGRTVIVTGAAGGIGAATVSRLAREGGRVIAVDLSEERLAEFAASRQGLDIIPVAGNITDQESIERIIDAAGDTIHGLANVAGINDDFSPLHETSDEMWDRVLDVNVTGTFKLTRAVLPAMMAASGGAIVNVASEAALRGGASGNAYTVSKHAVVGLTRSAAFMYGPHGIRVNAVAPGGVATGIPFPSSVSEAGSERLKPFQAQIPTVVPADDIAASITFLLSDDGVNLNGVVLPSDGGWSVQ